MAFFGSSTTYANNNRLDLFVAIAKTLTKQPSGKIFSLNVELFPESRQDSSLFHHTQDIEKALDEVLEERKEKVNPFEGRELDELNDEIDVCVLSEAYTQEEFLDDEDLAFLNDYTYVLLERLDWLVSAE